MAPLFARGLDPPLATYTLLGAWTGPLPQTMRPPNCAKWRLRPGLQGPFWNVSADKIDSTMRVAALKDSYNSQISDEKSLDFLLWSAGLEMLRAMAALGVVWGGDGILTSRLTLRGLPLVATARVQGLPPSSR